MPATSKAQFRFMAMVAHGKKTKKKHKGLSKEKALEFVKGVKMSRLPERSRHRT